MKPAEETRNSLLQSVERISREIAAGHADAVDGTASFPAEAFDALREVKALSAAVPSSYGGAALGASDLARLVRVLSRACSSSGMIFAMHQIQVVCLYRHCDQRPFFEGYLSRLVGEQRLIASVTSEAGVGGELRTSRAALEPAGDQLRLNKAAPVVSYGEHADDLLVTCRRGPTSAPNDQVLVLVLRNQARLERQGVWDTLGMRGTCSPAFQVSAEVSEEQVVPRGFGDIATVTMIPWSHVLWAACWLGISDQVLLRARKSVQEQARRTPGQSPASAKRLAELSIKVTQLESMVALRAEELDRLDAERRSETALGSVQAVIRFNELKVAAARLVVESAIEALRIIGIVGYQRSTPTSICRPLRDALSAPLMVNDDRILEANAALNLMAR